MNSPTGARPLAYFSSVELNLPHTAGGKKTDLPVLYALSEIGLARIGQLIDFRGEERAWRYALYCRAEDYAE